MSLVRLGIGQENASVPDSIDWTAMRTLASKPGLSAIVLDGIQSLCDKGLLADGRAMDYESKQSWVSLVLDKYELRYEHYTKRLAALAHFYNTHGFRLMALKGYGLGLNYPVPMHRPCGDIDIWAFFSCLNAICVEDFGFDESLFPDYRCTPVLRERVLNDALSPEFSDSEPAGLLPRVAWKYRRWNTNAWKQNLCYGDSRLKSFLVSAWSHLLKPSSI